MGPCTVFLKIFESQLCSHGSVEVEPRVDLLLAAQGIYPVYLSCDFNCLGGYTPGSSFGHMGIANIGSETDKCRLSLGWTNTYQPGSTNSLVYTLATDMGSSLHVMAAGSASSGMVDSWWILGEV